MSHGPATDWGEDKAADRKSRLGVQMFVVYALVYAAFVIANTLDPTLMATVVFGQSLAVVYGIGLIVFALVMAVVYNAISTGAEEQLNATDALKKEDAS